MHHIMNETKCGKNWPEISILQKRSCKLKQCKVKKKKTGINIKCERIPAYQIVLAQVQFCNSLLI